MPKKYEQEYADLYTMYVPSKIATVLPWLAVELSKPKTRGKLIDVGCGPAEVAPMATNLGYEYIGIEKNSIMLERAVRENPGLPIYSGDGLNLPAQDQSVKVVLLNMLIHSLETLWDLDMILEEANRVLEFNGLLLVSMLNEQKTAKLTDNPKQALQENRPKLIRYLAEFPKGVLSMRASHWRRHAVEPMLELCGFRNKERPKETKTYMLYTMYKKYGQ